MKNYDDIINLPHHQSKKHPQMSIYDRAAQFSPFAALTGHDAAIKEVARLTESRIELDESSKQIIDEKLQLIKNNISKQPYIEVTYFVADGRKAGGSYQTIKANVIRIDEYLHQILFDSGKKVSISDIIGVESDLF